MLFRTLLKPSNPNTLTHQLYNKTKTTSILYNNNIISLLQQQQCNVNTKSSEVRQGNLIDDNGKLYLVKTITKREMGRGHTTYTFELIDKQSYKKTYNKYNASDIHNVVDITIKKLSYLYNDGTVMYFMNNDTYEQIEVDINSVDSTLLPYLVENTVYQIRLYNDNVIDIDIPDKVVLTIAQADTAVKTSCEAGTVYKAATLSNGIKISVPTFIEKGDKILVKTKDSTYSERVSKAE